MTVVGDQNNTYISLQSHKCQVQVGSNTFDTNNEISLVVSITVMYYIYMHAILSEQFFA